MFSSLFILFLVSRYSEQSLEVLTKFTNAIKTGNREEIYATLDDNFKIIRCDSEEVLRKEDLVERYKNIPGENLFFNNYTVLEKTDYGNSILYMLNISGVAMSFFEIGGQKIISETQRNCEQQPITTSLINDPQMIASYTISRYLDALKNHSLIQDVLANDYECFLYTVSKFNRTEYINALTSTSITKPLGNLREKYSFYLEVYVNERKDSIATIYFSVTREYRISYESQMIINYQPFPTLSALIDYGVVKYVDLKLF
ncbi:unnamed protein product [Caenorhabditis angaria]|uniref:NTF2-like domain-containing protein n=1 Tax=Caenorhabditis angaria TaxID=860376 RepID=A0A9P1IR75_9PELO|nr:unnamed protein product [Caenorhabditis angaria]